jgi:hypothetical protein
MKPNAKYSITLWEILEQNYFILIYAFTLEHLRKLDDSLFIKTLDVCVQPIFIFYHVCLY